eukprot:1594763-Rhodomonas_salina.1
MQIQGHPLQGSSTATSMVLWISYAMPAMALRIHHTMRGRELQICCAMSAMVLGIRYPMAGRELGIGVADPEGECHAPGARWHHC